MEKMQSSWRKTNLFPTTIGGQVLTPFCQNLMLSDSDRFREINDLHTRLIDSDAPIMRNSEGEWAIYMDGVYYPIQRGRWLMPEEDEIIDDDGNTRVWFDAWKYNAIVEVQGLHFLMYIERIKKLKMQ